MSDEDTQILEEVGEQLVEEYYCEQEAYEDADILRDKVLELIETDIAIQEKIIEIIRKKKYNLFSRIVGAIIEHFSGSSIGGELAQDVAQSLWEQVKKWFGY